MKINLLKRRDGHNIGQYIIECVDWSNANQDFNDLKDNNTNIDDLDSIKLVKILFKYGISVDPYTAACLWEERSGKYDAQFLVLPNSEEKIMEDIIKYCEDFNKMEK